MSESHIQHESVQKKPYISFVVVGRNDNYGGNFTERLQLFIDVLNNLGCKHKLDAELIIVEWNPPEENPPLADVINMENVSSRIPSKIVTVPGEVHKTFLNSDKMKLYEYAGKNVGIRRAAGDYILATNPDILFSEELIRFLSEKKLAPNKFYRTARYDVRGPIPQDASVEELLAYCKQHVTRINGYRNSFKPDIISRMNVYQFTLHLYFHIRLLIRYYPYSRPFTNASGDFLLMHRDQWLALNGYPEITGVAGDGLPHSDSIAVNMAVFKGLKQVIFNNRLRIYHQEHDIPISRGPFSSDIESMRKQLITERKLLNFNSEAWGLDNYTLKETVIS